MDIDQYNTDTNCQSVIVVLEESFFASSSAKPFGIKENIVLLTLTTFTLG